MIGRFGSARSIGHGAAGCRLQAMLRNSSASGQAAAKAMRTRDLFAARTSAATMRANQLRLWFAAMAYVLLCAPRRIGLAHTQFAEATCGTIRLKLLKLGLRISVRRIKFAMASACPWQDEFALAHARLREIAASRGPPEVRKF